MMMATMVVLVAMLPLKYFPFHTAPEQLRTCRRKCRLSAASRPMPRAHLPPLLDLHSRHFAFADRLLLSDASFAAIR
jgi:hypothetical protein